MSRRAGALVVLGLIIACSSSDERTDDGDDQQACASNAECNGYTGRGLQVFQKRSPLCVSATCNDGYCVATPTSGALVDDVRGDCLRPRCDADGYIAMANDPSDVGTPSVEECKLKYCEPGIVGDAAIREQSVSEGVPCILSSGTRGTGECRFGECIVSGGGADGGRFDASDASDADASDDQ